MEFNTLNTIIIFFESYKVLILWLSSISLFIFLFSLISMRWLAGLIPSDYFIRKDVSRFRTNNSLLWYLVLLIKNILGYSLIIGGIMMLVLPGQGLFTIIIGLMLSNYPGKYYIEKRFVEIPAVFKSINWLRAKSNKPPIILK
ncbi:hypothetical protein N9J70_02715 [Gammaproteobacteria bacterium]|nr:hypothetical protein [Gammaproteobacteria bacterium]MDA9113548.1 hypothetical protein [Gammaproteobacteria bacterium]